jgi:hypothetical protein
MIRRLIRWIARKEIARAYEAASLIERAFVDKLRELAQATGELEGMTKALEAMEQEIRVRDGTYICRCDVERVRARLHQ